MGFTVIILQIKLSVIILQIKLYIKLLNIDLSNQTDDKNSEIKSIEKLVLEQIKLFFYEE